MIREDAQGLAGFGHRSCWTNHKVLLRVLCGRSEKGNDSSRFQFKIQGVKTQEYHSKLCSSYWNGNSNVLGNILGNHGRKIISLQIPYAAWESWLILMWCFSAVLSLLFYFSNVPILDHTVDELMRSSVLLLYVRVIRREEHLRFCSLTEKEIC